jgi:hypothetical protein
LTQISEIRVCITSCCANWISAGTDQEGKRKAETPLSLQSEKLEPQLIHFYRVILEPNRPRAHSVAAIHHTPNISDISSELDRVADVPTVRMPCFDVGGF